MALLLMAVPIMAFAHGISEADKQSMLDGGYVRYIGLGASHMLTGYATSCSCLAWCFS
jgi:hypothetical protein